VNFENFSKKGCFLSFEWEKTNFTTFGPPGKILEKSPGAPPPGKNPSDTHGTDETAIAICLCLLNTASLFPRFEVFLLSPM